MAGAHRRYGPDTKALAVGLTEHIQRPDREGADLERRLFKPGAERAAIVGPHAILERDVGLLDFIDQQYRTSIGAWVNFLQPFENIGEQCLIAVCFAKQVTAGVASQ